MSEALAREEAEGIREVKAEKEAEQKGAAEALAAASSDGMKCRLAVVEEEPKGEKEAEE